MTRGMKGWRECTTEEGEMVVRGARGHCITWGEHSVRKEDRGRGQVSEYAREKYTKEH